MNKLFISIQFIQWKLSKLASKSPLSFKEVIVLCAVITWFSFLFTEVKESYYQCTTDTQCEFLHPWGVEKE